MNFSKMFFELCKKEKFDAFEYRETEEKNIIIKYFKGAVKERSIQKDFFVKARAEKNNKIATANVNIKTKDSLDFLIKSLKDNLELNDNKKINKIFPGLKSYTLFNSYQKNLDSISIKTKENNIKKINSLIKNFSPKISQTTINYCESESKELIMNNYGLKLHDHSNNYFYSVITEGHDNGKIRNSYSYFFDNNINKFNCKTFAQEAAKKLLKTFSPINIQTGNYPIIFNQDSTGDLLNAYCEALSSEDIQKGISKFTGKLNKQVASNIVTIEEHSLQKDLFFSGYDSELYPKQNQTFIKDGILVKIAYNLETAIIDHTSSTGNGKIQGSKVEIGFNHLYLKQGTKSLDKMMENIKSGVYITELTGFNASFNSRSGNFSLRASGFLIKNGKIFSSIKGMTVAGNLFDLFKNIHEIANDIKILPDSTEVPSILVNSLRVTAE